MSGKENRRGECEEEEGVFGYVISSYKEKALAMFRLMKQKGALLEWQTSLIAWGKEFHVLLIHGLVRRAPWQLAKMHVTNTDG